MCLSQPSFLYQRCFLFPLLKGPGFPTVFLENCPIFEGFLRAKCFPTVKARAQGCKKIYKIKSRRKTHTPGKNTCDRTLQICIKYAMCFSQWYVPVLCFLFFLFFPSPEVPDWNPWNFFTRRSRRGTLETLLLVFFLFVVFRRPSCFNGDP